MLQEALPKKVGIIAGWGRYPLVVAEALRAQGTEVYTLGIRDHADPILAEMSNAFDWIGLGQIGKVVRFFHRHGVSEATMAGKVHKVRLFQKWAWLHHLPDWRGVLTYYPHFITRQKTTQDDSLLGAIVASLGRYGITMCPATDFVPELLVKLACLTTRRPTLSFRRRPQASGSRGPRALEKSEQQAGNGRQGQNPGPDGQCYPNVSQHSRSSRKSRHYRLVRF